MSNWNKVNSEMYSLTDGPYHCIVRESGQMYYCEVFRNDDLILVSTVEGLQEAKNTCEIEILADLQKRGLFNARIAEQPIFGKQYPPVVFDFKDTGGKEDAIKLPKGWYLSAGGKEYKRKLGDYAAVVTPLSDDRAFLSVIQHSKGNLTCLVRFDGKAALYRDTLEESIKIANSRLESTYESDCSNDKKDCSGYFTSSEGGVGFLLGKHLETIDRYKERVAKTHAQAAKAVEDGCKAATGQEPKYKWKEVTSNNHSLKHGKFYAMAYSVLGGGWSALVKDEEDGTYVLNELTDTKQNAKELVEHFLKGYYEGPEAKLDEARKKQPNPTEVEETVIAQIRKRRDVGREKYGTTMERKDLSFIQWLQHLQEELLDAAIYAEKLKRSHRKELLSDMIADDENSGLYEA